MSIGIYKITNLVNNKSYIGQSIHIEKRWQEHCRNSSNSLIAQEIKLFGKENFSFEILLECSKEQLNEKEEFYIKYFNTIYPNGYNKVEVTSSGGQSCPIKISSKQLDEIINDLKNTDKSINEIANIYNIDISMVYYINRGDYRTKENEQYPLRKVREFKTGPFYCVDCGAPISRRSTRCKSCAAKISNFERRKVKDRPSREQLKAEIRSNSFLQLGKKYGVSDNTIRKWCESYNLPSSKITVDLYSDLQWEKI